MTKQMQFPDYDGLVISNKEIYLNSIIDRYGEENRELLSKRYDATKICFFTNVTRLKEYVKYKSRDVITSEIKSFFEEIGIINLDEKTKAIFFGDYLDEKIFEPNLLPNNIGIFAFLEANNNKNDTERQRELFLSKFNQGDLLLYKSNSRDLIIDKYAKIAEYAYSKLKKVMEKYSDILEYRRNLILEEDKLYDDRLRAFFSNIVDFLCDEDRQIVISWLNGNKKIAAHKLKDYPLFLNDVSNIKSKRSKKDLMFEPGLVEYFGLKISSEFLASSPERKAEINSRRIKYLKMVGFDTKEIESKYDLSSFDISKLNEIKPFLPRESLIEKVREHREFSKKKIAKTFFEKNIINSVELPYDYDYEDVLECSYNIGDSWISLKPTLNVFDVYAFFGPLDNGYDVFDSDFDHEITHSLETSVQYLPNGDLFIKTGIQFDIIKKSGRIIRKNENINEAITELLSIDSTRRRYANEQYIFEKPKNPEAIEDCAIYAKNIQKARALVEFLPPEFIKRRIETTIDFIYEYFDQNTWDELDNMIDDDDVSTEEFIDYIESKRRKSL